LTDLRRLRLRLRELVRANPRALDVDDAGAPVVRGEVLAISPTPASLAIARQAGFVVARRTMLEGLGVELVVLSAPEGTSARQALKMLRQGDPAGRYDLDHIYSPAGAVDAPAIGSAAETAHGADAKIQVGLLDTGVAREHPAFADSRIEQRGFAPGGVKAADHGTAVASLMVGHAARFSGAAPGATLFAADVYGSGPAGGSADAIARALGWMADNRIAVVNVSLVGPANLTLETAIDAMLARGALIVAPVGNDGPAAPPLYPASYPGVIAVTAVDARGRTLFEAGRARHVDFAAPGAGLVAARAGGGFAGVRGTSFAAPIVAGRLALLLREPDPAQATAAKVRLGAEARAGRGPVLSPPTGSR
jgi:subtilisin family serine protease